ncbi:riboflavin kinase [Candidatus Paracaedibacter symbiosus]|uniref:riboflavin kinase n=1 Tax=Candidatus Paracaedibacter symbiosus TaxID=244582 RepID=UPI000509DF2C|nr:riboflavin kinase [Candidatus Paracaedibacter symbiosus]
MHYVSKNKFPILVGGTVQYGQQKARLYGTPTANIHTKTTLSPGVYGGYTSVPDRPMLQQIPSLCYVSDTLVEAYLVDRDLDLYNANIQVELLWFHRSPVVFESDKQMAVLIQDDLKILREWFELT